jgi:feruloyl esterase
LPGSELSWADRSLGFLAAKGDADAYYRNMIFGLSAGLTSDSFNFDEDYRRLGLAIAYADDNPDLRKFMSAGGKLVAYQGSYDALEGPSGIIDYFTMVEATMGGRLRAGSFFRLFLIPGMNHCTGGVGPFAIDYLYYLEMWVEHGKAPEFLVGAHIDDTYLDKHAVPGSESDSRLLQQLMAAAWIPLPLKADVPVTFTRPIYAYPYFARYKGKGDPKDWRSFEPKPN